MVLDDFPVLVNDDPRVNLRQISADLYIGAQSAPMDRVWDLVVDLHGVNGARTRYWIKEPFPDGQPFPDGLLDQVRNAIVQARSDLACQAILIACEMGMSRSASCGYAMLRELEGLGHDEAYARISSETTFQAGPKTLSVSWPREKTLSSARAWVERRR